MKYLSRSYSPLNVYVAFAALALPSALLAAETPAETVEVVEVVETKAEPVAEIAATEGAESEEASPPKNLSSLQSYLPNMPAGFWGQIEEKTLIGYISRLPASIKSAALTQATLRSLSSSIDREDATADLLELRLEKAAKLRATLPDSDEELAAAMAEPTALDIPLSLLRIDADERDEAKRRALLAYGLHTMWMKPLKANDERALQGLSYRDGGITLSTAWREQIARALESDRQAEAFYLLVTPLNEPLNRYHLQDVLFVVQTLRNLRLHHEASLAAYEALAER